MTVRRVMGLETEFGISVPGHPTMNSMATATRLVMAYARNVLTSMERGVGWDYDRESPLRDARGYDMSLADADPSQLTDADPGLANAVLTSGARLYVDHAHPEYSTPEITSPRDAVIWDRAGMLIMARAAELALESGPAITLYKNNTDNKGASYGTHENYLMQRETAFADIVRHLTPFFITRQVFTGSGRVGLGQDGSRQGFQLSQRADFFEAEVGLETTLKRPIINTRDEPHANPEKYRRLHVIVGDANLADVANYLKIGVTSLIISMLEAGALDRLAFMPAHPVAEMHAVSHDPGLQHRIQLASGQSMSALQMQFAYFDAAVEFVADQGLAADDETHVVMQRWGAVLDRLSRDPMECVTELDWVAKLALLEGFRTRDGLDWGAHRLQAIDLQYSDVRPDKGLAARLEARGRLERLVSDEEVLRAVASPPEDTRAYFRGECLRRYPQAVAAASWDSVVFDIPGRAALQRVPTVEPERGTRRQVEALLDRSPTASDLITLLAAPGGLP